MWKCSIRAICDTFLINIICVFRGTVWYTFPCVCIILNVITIRAYKNTHLYICIFVCKHLHSCVYCWAICSADLIDRVSILSRRTIHSLHTVRIAIHKSVVWTGWNTLILHMSQRIISIIVIWACIYTASISIKRKRATLTIFETSS